MNTTKNLLKLESPQTQQPPTKKLKLGEILVQEGILTPDDLEKLLSIQKNSRTYKQLGQLCVEKKYLSQVELKRILAKYQKSIRIGELFVNMGLINPDQLEIALQEQTNARKRLGQILIDLKMVTEVQLAQALSYQLDIPFIEPDPNLIDRTLLEKVNERFMRKYLLIPALVFQGVLTVMMADPLAEDLIDQMAKVFRCEVVPAVATATSITEVLNQIYSSMEVIKQEQLDSSVIKDLIIEDGVTLKKERSIVYLANYIISNAIKERATDIHIEPQEKKLQIRYRIDGMLHHKLDLPIVYAPALCTRIKAIAGMDISDKRRHQDGRIEAKIMGKEVDLRISSYASVFGESIVIRVLLRHGSLIDLNYVGFSPAHHKIFQQTLDYSAGIILVTGPTGSGKTTTLYASVNYLNSLDRKIITVEDPVEYTMDGIVQGQIDPKLGLSYMDFLKSIMRQDPDVIMVGEIRDRLAAEVTIQAALTGHKVLTTFHTEDSTGALIRLMDMGIETFLISSTVVAVLTQRLVRAICPNCKERVTPDPNLVAQFQLKDFDPTRYNFSQGKGCRECRNIGYYGRTGIYELLKINDPIRESILMRKPTSQLRLVARDKAHLLSLREDGLYKAAKGITTLEEVLRRTAQNEVDDYHPRSMEEIIALSENSGFNHLKAAKAGQDTS